MTSTFFNGLVSGIIPILIQLLFTFMFGGLTL